ncbi:(2Fe-2S)-binding protein [Pseudoroseomonas wenyumeiae]
MQAAFLAEQAGQCGWCLSGILVSAAALLRRNPAPDEAAVRAALEPHLCRCGAQNRMIRAVLRAAGRCGHEPGFRLRHGAERQCAEPARKPAGGAAPLPLAALFR